MSTCLVVLLAQENVGDSQPPGGLVEVGVVAEYLKGDDDRKRIEIDLVDTAIDDEVAEDAEEDQEVDPAGRENERRMRKAGPGGVGEDGGGDEDEPAVKLRAAAPEDCERKERREEHQIHQLNDHECGDARVRMRIQAEMEAVHAACSEEADCDERDGQRHSKPAERAMDADVVGAHQRGLQDEEEQPSGKNDGVDGKDEGRDRRGVQEVMVDCVAEAKGGNGRDQQRHEEVEVLLQETGGPGHRHGRSSLGAQ